MEKTRIISVSLMLIAIMLMIMLSKACMNNSEEAKNRNKAASEPEGPHIATDFTGSREPDSVPVADETLPEETTVYIEYVTDLIGQVIETVVHTEALENEPAETTEDTRSILEKYNDEQASIAAEREESSTQGGAVFGGRDPQLTTEIILEIG